MELTSNLIHHIEQRIEERTVARKFNDLITSNAIEDELKLCGITLEDSPDGTRWKVLAEGEE